MGKEAERHSANRSCRLRHEGLSVLAIGIESCVMGGSHVLVVRFGFARLSGHLRENGCPPEENGSVTFV